MRQNIMQTGFQSPETDPNLNRRVDRVRWLSHLLDSRFRVPGTQIRFGYDSVIGLIPGVGDAVGLLLSTYPVYVGWRSGLPGGAVFRMFGNVIVDSVVGSVPLIGDVFDLFWRANKRNLKILERYDTSDEHSNAG